MATFTNQARLAYNNRVINSNTATGEIIDSIQITHTPMSATYFKGDKVTFIVSIVNSGDTDANNLTLNVNLGEYTLNGLTLYPLEYVAGTVRYYVNGVLQPTPSATSGSPLVITGISVPSGGNAMIVYETEVTNVAPCGLGSTISNVATLEGTGLAVAPTDTAVITVSSEPELSISKSFSPTTVQEDEQLTITLVIQNYSCAPLNADGNAVITDTINPILSNITVVYNGQQWQAGTNYTYNDDTGLFTTLPGQISVPAATFVQNPSTGVCTVTPGVTTITVTGTV